MTGWQVSRKEPLQSRAAIFLAVCVLCGGPWFARGATAPSAAARNEVVPLTQITPARGKEFLSRFKLVTACQLGQSKTFCSPVSPKSWRRLSPS